MANGNLVQFQFGDADIEVRLARFIAELERQGIAYDARETAKGYEVEITGY